MVNIAFWKNKDGNFRSDIKGLSGEEIEFLHSLKEGDKLVLFQAEPMARKYWPDLKLTKSV
jgi:hypothetical protein